MREFALADGSVLVLQNEVDLLNITTIGDASPRYLAVVRPIADSVKVSPSSPQQSLSKAPPPPPPPRNVTGKVKKSPSSPPQAGFSNPAGPRARAEFFFE